MSLHAAPLFLALLLSSPGPAGQTSSALAPDVDGPTRSSTATPARAAAPSAEEPTPLPARHPCRAFVALRLSTGLLCPWVQTVALYTMQFPDVTV